MLTLGVVMGVAVVIGLLALAYLGREALGAQSTVAPFVAPQGLTPAQVPNAMIILREFHAAGLGWMGPAAIANALAESNLNASAVGDGGRSVGLFQLNSSTGAAGEGMSEELRMDPVVNTRRIIEVVRAMGGEQLDPTWTHGQVTTWFAADVENCADCGGAWAKVNNNGSTADIPRRLRLLDRAYPGYRSERAR